MNKNKEKNQENLKSTKKEGKASTDKKIEKIVKTKTKNINIV